MSFKEEVENMKIQYAETGGTDETLAENIQIFGTYLTKFEENIRSNCNKITS
jgi:hypothetical protein